MKLATITLNKPSSECNTCIFFNSIIRSQLKYGFTDKVMVISPFIREAASVAVATTYNDCYVETFQEKLKFNCSYRESQKESIEYCNYASLKNLSYIICVVYVFAYLVWFLKTWEDPDSKVIQKGLVYKNAEKKGDKVDDVSFNLGKR
ncbi:hypothetical protein EDC94DRAFT_585451 [Helicostylum pulchrum]|nr:hypothetical protein EDC94DRAFT_585451 [Helicostylum pulchrum]